MPNLPDIPGRAIIEGTTKRVRVLAVGAGAGALAVGGFVLKRALGHGEDAKVDTDPIAEAPTAPPGAEEKPVPKAGPPVPKAAPKPKVADDKPRPAEPKPKADKPKPPKPKAKPAKSAKPKGAAKSKPRAPTGTDAPPKPEFEPGNISADRDHPHRALNNPVADPDETEYPDPFEQRPDPRDPVDPDGAPFGEEPHPQTGSESTSEPPPSQDPTVVDGGKPPRRDKLDD